MLLISVGVGFVLIFAVLISDAFSGSSARSSSTPVDKKSRTRTVDDEAQSTSSTERPRSIGPRRRDDGLGRAA